MDLLAAIVALCTLSAHLEKGTFADVFYRSPQRVVEPDPLVRTSQGQARQEMAAYGLLRGNGVIPEGWRSKEAWSRRVPPGPIGA